MMKSVLLRYLTLTFLLSLLAGCFGPQTPEEVAADFWGAVAENDADEVAALSTLSDPKKFDGFDKEWAGYQPRWGKIIIDGNKARIDTTLTAADSDERELTTYLVQRDDDWLVDYERTAKSARGGLFGSLFSKVGELSKEWGDRFNQSAEEANQQLDQLLEELEENQLAFSQQAEQALENYSAQLQQSLHALEESIQQTLDDQASRLSDEDKQTLKETAAELERRLRDIDPDSIESAVENSKALAELRDRLEQLDTEALEKQKKQWQELSESLAKDVETLMESLSQK